MAFSRGIVSNCFALFTNPITEGLGVSIREFEINQTLMFVTPQVENVIRKVELIRENRPAVLALVIIYSGYAFSSELWQFYGRSILLGH